MKIHGSQALGILGFLALLGSPGGAQGVLPLNGDYAYAILEAEFGFDCGSAAALGVSSEIGLVSFAPNGTLGGSSWRRRVCADGTSVDWLDTMIGTHVHDESGELVVDLDPTAPGTDVSTLALRFDHGLILFGHASDTHPRLGIAVPRAAGASAAMLLGQYAYVRESFNQDTDGFHAVCDLGTVTFDGIGGYVLACERHVVTPTQTLDLQINQAGPYTVTPDGLLMFGDTPHYGALTPDGQVAFWLERVDIRQGLAVVFKREGVYAADEVFGPWHSGNLSAKPGPLADDPEIAMLTATTDLDGQAGTFTVDGQLLEARPSGTTLSALRDAGTILVQPDGTVAMQPSGGTTALPGALDSTRTLLALASVHEPGYVEVGLVARKLVPAAAYGDGTPGSGAVAPTLAATGGLSFVGNRAFALEVSQALEQAGVFLGLSQSPLLGLPALGGALWIDPRGLFFTASATASGTSGAPGAGLAAFRAPIPPDPLLAGLDVYGQALVVDGGAPGGWAFSRGLAFQIW